MPSPLKKTPALNQPTTRTMKSAAPPKTKTTGVATTTHIATVIRLRMLQGSERIDVLRHLGLRNQDLVLAFRARALTGEAGHLELALVPSDGQHGCEFTVY